MRTTKPVYPVEVDYECDKCHNGHMRSTGVTLTSNPPLYPHRCDECGYEQTFRECYPYVYYETNPTPARTRKGRNEHGGHSKDASELRMGTE